jgi:hypothetical protein
MIRYIFQFVETEARAEFWVDTERAPTDHSHRQVREPWTALDFHKCPSCPLNSEQTTHCPAALDLQSAVIQFKNTRSTEVVDATAETPLRTVHKRCDFQTAFQSYMGLVMALSACPILGKFRGAALYHLPFASLDETIIRNVGFYLLKQHFLLKNNEQTDFELHGLAKIYDDVNTVNLEFQNRLRNCSQNDGNVNAIVQWWSTAALLTSMNDILAPFEPLFVQKKK